MGNRQQLELGPVVEATFLVSTDATGMRLGLVSGFLRHHVQLVVVEQVATDCLRDLYLTHN